MTAPEEVAVRARRLALGNAIAHGDAPRAGPILARLLGSDPSLRSEASRVQAIVEAAIAEVAALSPDARRTRLEELGGGEPARARPAASTMGEFPELANARSGHVVLRMAPFPSGALHIGNARMLFVNQYYRERYDGRLLLVFDDTIGSGEKRVEKEFFELILGDLDRAGVTPDAIFYKSDRIPQFYPWARRVIDRGGAYVCTCPAELLRENRALGRACGEREQVVEETIPEWERMLDGSYGPGEATLRLRTDIQDPDPAFRDRVLMRISDADHPLVGHRYRVWPMLEFSWAVDDVELGITHVIRGKDLVIEDRMERFLWELLGIRGPEFLHWGLLRVREAKVSKSKSYAEVKSGLYDGWADPRTWSLRSLERRGISMEALRRFTLGFGLSLADVEVPAESLYAENRKIIDSRTVRRSFVADPIEVTVAGFPPDLSEVSLANHPDEPSLGRRSAPAGPAFQLARADLAAHAGEEIRLKDLANLRIPDAIPPEVKAIGARFTSRENRRLPRIQWVGSAGAIPVDLLLVDGLHTAGVGERALGSAAEGEIFQFERVGFVRVDRAASASGGTLHVAYGHP